MSETIRYYLDSDVKYLYNTPDFKGERYRLPSVSKFQKIFLNILDIQDHAIKIKIFLPEGDCHEGWVCEWSSPLKIHNEEKLFDGRFNQ